jgi:hypothetical protein
MEVRIWARLLFRNIEMIRSEADCLLRIAALLHSEMDRPPSPWRQPVPSSSALVGFADILLDLGTRSLTDPTTCCVLTHSRGELEPARQDTQPGGAISVWGHS